MELKILLKNIFLVISVIALLLGLGSFGFYYVDTYNKLQADYEECEVLFEETSKTSFTPKFFDCRQVVWSDPLVGYEYTKNDISIIKEKIKEESYFLKVNVDNSLKEKEILEKQLDGLEVDYEKEYFNDFSDKYILLERLTDYNKNLKKTLEKNEIKVYNLISLTETTNRVYPFLNEQQKAFLIEYKEGNVFEKNVNYSLLKKDYVYLQDKIIDQIYKDEDTNPGVSKEIFGEELFRYKFFTAEDFTAINNFVNFVENDSDKEAYPVTGNKEADERLAKIAESRGYIKRKEIDTAKLVDVHGERVTPEVKLAWSEMEKEASKEGIKLKLNSGYRSRVDQKTLFLERMESLASWKYGLAFTPENINKGILDKAIDENLEVTALPGYSKHHSGMTVDIVDDTPGQENLGFANTNAYRWISKNNFYNAKRFGFIPSYPETNQKIGPNPEPWEFVWVGKDYFVIDFEI